MAQGLPKRGACKEGKGVGSRRIFAPHFKLQVLDSYRNDADCKGNQRATARKYGIHRRQIQKWLQAEGSLRSSVKGPQEGPAPLDCTTQRASPPPAPMDLSLKRPPSAPATPPAPRVPSPLGLARPHPDVWDLSTKRKCESEGPPRPVKLFKPYLDDDVPRRPEPPPCCAQTFVRTNSGCAATYAACDAACDATCYYNNNNVCDIKSEYGTYTLHELQPQTSPTYYYYPSAYAPEYEIGPFCPAYEDPNYAQTVAPLKQRHSYSLDFKLSAIECYYQDSVCKGNQRAVATKYNIHRRQVQKWLKQADELKQKNESIKQTQTVR